MNKICKNCHREYECYDKPGGHSGLRRAKHKRAFNSVTCSPKCSREYNYNNKFKRENNGNNRNTIK
jgi:hypothetical protein